MTGVIQSPDPRQNCPVLYAGAVERLPYRFDSADSLLLRVLFRSFARELQARFEEEATSPQQDQDDLVETETSLWLR